MSYPGGKGGIYQKIINLMPLHEVYIESHLGGGAIMLYKRPARCNIGIDLDPRVIKTWTVKPHGNIELINEDAVQFLNEFRFTGKELVYCDPPYLMETRRGGRLYDFEYSRDHHKELLEIVKSLPCMVMISGYYSELYAEALEEWNTVSFQAQTRQGTATEWLWMNYPPPVELHDYRYLGGDFRERERIKRKINRWVSRLESMPLLERQALTMAVNSLKSGDPHSLQSRAGVR